MAGPAASSARQCRISRSACTDSRRGWCRGCRGDRRAPASRPLGSAARAGNRWLCSLRTRWPPPAGSVLPRSGRQADSATRTRIASAWAGTLDHASGPPVRAGSWSTTRLAGGPDAISRLEGVWLVQLARQLAVVLVRQELAGLTASLNRAEIVLSRPQAESESASDEERPRWPSAESRGKQ